MTHATFSVEMQYSSVCINQAVPSKTASHTVAVCFLIKGGPNQAISVESFQETQSISQINTSVADIYRRTFGVIVTGVFILYVCTVRFYLLRGLCEYCN